ncbi:uncharacterized protein Dwil_GK17564 [Drosophila willistoni]|uniref:Uncharacterized protein n=1 Tax=Drosophila willistoni TaxID=7260 RepID=B4MMR1_DROWI|nr:uncharacterized protein LOC6639252 [Drosophila willistoni]EDW73467.1 uncharacterized protein Dwil_GK17564 [Drosophila willistoni]
MFMEQHTERPALERELISYRYRKVDPERIARRSSDWIMGLIFVYTIMSLMIVKVASTAALYQQQQQEELLNHIESLEGDKRTESNSDIEKMRAKLQQLQLEQQQQYRQQQQQQMQLHLQQMQQVVAGGAGGVAAGENAYLLERADDIAPPAPIYGTWRTKARRPLLQHAISLNEVDDNHLYERLPKRSATMTPLKGVLRDQMPRPPRLATQIPPPSGGPPSTALLRRQYSETPGTLAQRQDDFKPKPFHFPYDGPLPEQFHKGGHTADVSERPELNNIQDILHHLHIANGASKLPPPLMMMPTGLHIAGSFKNFKSSGIGNFFRGKRQKKQMQFSIPLPMALGHMPMMMPMPMPMQLYGPSGPHQRVAIEQLYPYKPRSPQDINLLAMQPLPLPAHKPVSKKKKKKLQQQQQSNQNLLLEHGSQQQQHFVTDPYHFPPIITLNATRQPQLKRVPFKVNLDIYPVLPPSRPMSVALRHPFQNPEYGLPTTAGGGGGIYQQTPFKFPTQSPLPPSSQQQSMSFPDQATHFSHHHHQQHHHKFPPPPPHQDDCIYGAQPSGPVTDAQANQIMLHLNVFPKQKPIATAAGGAIGAATATASIRASTNPFHNNNNFQRNSIHSTSNNNNKDNDLPLPPSPIEPRHQATNGTMANSNQNQTNPSTINRTSSISRSDNLSLIDFEHPIVAADVPELPQPAPLVGVGVAMGMGQRYPKSANIDQLAAEAQTASLFRFPVEDLIQFQVDDAL